MTRSVRHTVSTLVCTLVVGTSLAHAQATRTWVSGVGDDANPCSRTAPCKTFAGAISKTAAGGEISVLDPGGFGGVTITKSITINGEGTLAGILGAGTNGIIVNAGVNDVVIVRNVSINGGGTGLNGIRYLAGGTLVVERVDINSFTGIGIDVSLGANVGRLMVTDTRIRGGSIGVRATATGGSLRATLDGVSIQGTIHGIDASVGFLTVNRSSIAQTTGNGASIYMGANAAFDNSLFSNNNLGVIVSPGSTVLLSNNGFYNNGTAFGCGGGTLASAGNNRTASSGAGCLPNATVQVQ